MDAEIESLHLRKILSRRQSVGDLLEQDWYEECEQETLHLSSQRELTETL